MLTVIVCLSVSLSVCLARRPGRDMFGSAIQQLYSCPDVVAQGWSLQIKYIQQCVFYSLLDGARPGSEPT